MGTEFKDLGYDELYRNAGNCVVLINDMVDLTLADRQRNDEQTSTIQVGEKLSTVPSCRCGAETGEFYANIPDFLCPVCDTPVVDPASVGIEFNTFLKRPPGLAPFIKLNVYYMLGEALLKATTRQLDVLAYVTNPQHRVGVLPKTTSALMDVVKEIIEENGGVRGYNQFVNNLDNYLRLFRERLLNDTEDVVALYRLIEKYKFDGTLFSDYLPILNKAMIVQERTNSSADTARIYMDETLAGFFDCYKGLRGIDARSNQNTIRKKEAIIAQAMIDLSRYTVAYFDNFTGGKPGILRRNICGFRSGYTARAVISAIVGEHEPDEFLPSWTMFIANYRQHIINKLLRRGYSAGEIEQLYQAIPNPQKNNPTHQKWYKEINEIIDELIAESPQKALAWFVNRNPTLPRGSTQKMYVPDVNRDPRCLPAGHPVSNVTTFNADFDGDALQYCAIVLGYIADMLDSLHVSTSFLSISKPFAVQNAVSLPSPLAITLAFWSEHETTNSPDVQLDKIDASQQKFLKDIME